MTIDERIEFLMQSIEGHDRQIGELTEAVNELVKVSNEMRPLFARWPESQKYTSAD